MVSSYLVEALTSPTKVIEELWNSRPCVASAGDSFPEAVAKHFSTIFSTDDTFAEIPPLSVEHPPETFPDRALVRFRAMVQDTSLSPEMYMSQLCSGKPGGWGLSDPEDHASESTSINYDHLRDCTVLWVVSVPGESEWYRGALDQHAIEQSQQKHQASRPHKNPIPQHAHIGAQVKLYQSLGNNALKTTDIVEFVGVLTKEPLCVEGDTELVPTVHVLFTRPQTLRYSLPITPGMSGSTTNELKHELVSWIANEALGGDLHAAEWILLATIDRVHSRKHSLNPLTLTISQFPPSGKNSAIPTISHIMSTLLPMSITLPLSLETLNSVPFIPQSKHEDLHSGVLQVASGTTFLITEDALQEGKLEEQGISNVLATQNVMTTQTLSYTFPFSKFTFPTEINFIILSQGRNSVFFKTDINIPLQPASDSILYKPKADIQMPSEEQLQAFRCLLLHAKLGHIEVPEAISKQIQNDFVLERKSNKPTSSDDLKRMISMARLAGLLSGERELTIDIWEQIKAFDAQCQARCS